MEITIILILSICLAIFAITIIIQSKQIYKLSNLLDKMDLALAKQHKVIDDQQLLIDDVVSKKFEQKKS